MARPKSTPTYCLHKRSNRGYATIDGVQKFFPGNHDSAQSRAAYDSLVGLWLGNGRHLPAAPDINKVTVSTVALAFWRHAKAFYRDADGTETGEAENYRPALRAMRRLYGATAAEDFGPKSLRALRSAMLLDHDETDPLTGKVKQRKGWSRTYANRQTDRIKSVFRWAASDEMIPASVPASLATVDAIRSGRDGARETEPVEPVADEIVDATLPHLPPAVAAMVKLQRLTAARGGELFKLRSCDLDMSEAVWKYRPAKHKTAHKGAKRTIRFGPQAQDIIRPFLKPDLKAYIFTPAESVAWRNDRQREKRKTPLAPSQKLRAAKAKPRKLRAHYAKDSYSRAVARACEIAFGMPARLRLNAPDVRSEPTDTPEQIAAKAAERARRAVERIEWHRQHVWSPHQLRHSAGTTYRREGDFEVAKIILGHQTDSMTEHYAQRDERKADEVVARIG